MLTLTLTNRNLKITKIDKLRKKSFMNHLLMCTVEILGLGIYATACKQTGGCWNVGKRRAYKGHKQSSERNHLNLYTKQTSHNKA